MMHATGFVAAAVQLGVLCCGLLLLAFQKLTAGPGALNESTEKPTFDEVGGLAAK
jgi:ABC-type transporter Mla subunit MlaD